LFNIPVVVFQIAVRQQPIIVSASKTSNYLLNINAKNTLGPTLIVSTIQ